MNCNRHRNSSFVGCLSKLLHSAVDLRMSSSTETTKVILPEPKEKSLLKMSIDE